MMSKSLMMLLAIAAVLAMGSEAQAFGKRSCSGCSASHTTAVSHCGKRGKRHASTCGTANASTCGASTVSTQSVGCSTCTQSVASQAAVIYQSK